MIQIVRHKILYKSLWPDRCGYLKTLEIIELALDAVDTEPDPVVMATVQDRVRHNFVNNAIAKAADSFNAMNKLSDGSDAHQEIVNRVITILGGLNHPHAD